MLDTILPRQKLKYAHHILVECLDGLNPSYWNYQNSSLDKVTQSIAYSNFTSQEERNELLRQALRLGIQESVRIFVTQNIDPYAVSSSIKGLNNDFQVVFLPVSLSLTQGQPKSTVLT